MQLLVLPVGTIEERPRVLLGIVIVAFEDAVSAVDKDVHLIVEK
jgi:hypothetical protein